MNGFEAGKKGGDGRSEDSTETTCVTKNKTDRKLTRNVNSKFLLWKVTRISDKTWKVLSLNILQTFLCISGDKTKDHSLLHLDLGSLMYEDSEVK